MICKLRFYQTHVSKTQGKLHLFINSLRTCVF